MKNEMHIGKISRLLDIQDLRMMDYNMNVYVIELLEQLEHYFVHELLKLDQDFEVDTILEHY
jgi:hypothetical protein